MNFINTELQVANMKKPQEFTHYPYDGSEFLNLQSDKRWIKLNIKTGEGIITAKNGQNTSWHLGYLGGVNFTMDKDELTKIQNIYIANDGKDGKYSNCLSWSNEKYLSKTTN